MFLFITCITTTVTTIESWVNYPLSSDLHLQSIRYERKSEYNNNGKIYRNTLQNTGIIVQSQEFLFYYLIPENNPPKRKRFLLIANVWKCILFRSSTVVAGTVYYANYIRHFTHNHKYSQVATV